MKKLISYLAFFGLLLFGTSAMAGPYAVTGEFPTAVVTKCKFTLNSGTAVDVLPTVQEDESKSICIFDVSGSTNGNNVVSVVYTNMWGSSTAVPLSYAKTLPPLSSGIHLKE